ncbi:MAG TPA: hypothetical protein VFR80_03825 [Pyrinomonadaceae bacterium]|nr:hypothetical protein [Pyrinomonadaceae bacterium]
MQNVYSFGRSFLISIGGVALLLFVTGCPKVPKVVRSKIPGASGESKLEVKVNISPAANNNNPVAVDLVLVKDKKLLQELMKMSASDWFEKRNQVELDYPKETELDAGRWEWVPGQQVKLDRVPVNLDIAGGVVFAKYFNAGTHRAPFDPRKGILITLSDENLCVQSLKESPKPCPPAKR